jgi:hypothetical protein
VSKECNEDGKLKRTYRLLSLNLFFPSLDKNPLMKVVKLGKEDDLNLMV